MATFIEDTSIQDTTTSIVSTGNNISVFALTSDLNNLSTNSILSINNLNNTSTTIFNNLNSLSTNSILSINNLNSTSTTTFNNLNSLSTNSILSINRLNATSTTIFNNLNSLSTNSILSINNLNNTSTTTFNNLNSLSTNSILSINNLNNKTNFTNLLVSNASTLLSSLNITGNIIGSGTALTNLNYNAITNRPDLSGYAINTNLNSLSTSSTLSINNLNNTSTTIFNNLNSLSTNSMLSINNLNNTSTTIFNNLNSLSTNSTLSINNLNNTSTTIFNNLNSLSTNSILSINNLNNTSTTIFNNLNSLSTNSTLSINNLNNKTNFTNLLVSNASTLLSSLNITGNIIGSGTALTNLNYNAILNPPVIVNFNNPSTFVSTLNISGNTTLNNATTCISSLNVSGTTILQGDKLNFPNILNQYKINLWGSNEYGFGITSGSIVYSSQGFHRFFNSANNTNTFNIDSSGNTTINGKLIVSNNNSYPDLQLGSANGYNIGVATGAGSFSSSALIGDMVIRSIETKRLILQANGGGGAGIIIDSANNTILNGLTASGATTINNNMTINGDLYLKNNTWHRSVDGVYRKYYATNEISYYCCGGNSTDGHIFMNDAYSHVFKIKNNGDLFSSGKVGINTNSPNCQLTVNGIANIHNGSPLAVTNNYMQSGSLTIGGINVNYGTELNWTTNTSGLLMECQDYTSIDIHDSGTRIATFMYYDGVNNRFILGRDKGWGLTSIYIPSTLILPADRWILSGTSQQRIYYQASGSSYYQGYGSSPHIFRNGTGVDALTIYNSCDMRVEGEVTSKLYCISGNYRDLMGVYAEGTPAGSFGYYTYKIVEGTFTGFHRCFTDDELYNNDEPQLFKEQFEGRIVISTGKIATDTNTNDTDWIVLYDKDGITIEDALPITQLSRKKKDKRVFGVVGASKRNNSRPGKLIINSVGEGAIWVCNSNGNIENGDYITSSDYLGYGEKQDDDLLHNYTVAKATMDCTFELNSIYYNCIELDNGIRAAFISSTYHCG